MNTSTQQSATVNDITAPLSESEQLVRLAQKPALARIPSYVKLSGPGWLQGAMTLGGGSAITSLTIGAVYGYELLWVQPLSMIIGCIMLFVLSHQTLSTGMQPFEAMRRFVHPSIAWAWAIAALLSSIIWGFAHYPLCAGMLEDIIAVASGFDLRKNENTHLGREVYLLVLAIAVWAVCAYTAWNYNKSGRSVALFENTIKILSGLIILSFAWVVIKASINGQIHWPSVLAGYIPASLPNDSTGVMTIMAALGTAVGINMTFIYGYNLLQRGWGKQHRELARYDIVLGLVLPYILVTSLISIAAAGVFYGSELSIQGKLSPIHAGQMFSDAGMGPLVGRLVFAFGVLGMAVGSLVMHMLCCGAAIGALFKLNQASIYYRLALLLPTPAILGVFLWSSMGAYVVLPTSAICGLLLPIAYIGWWLLNSNKSYLGNDRPTGNKALLIHVAIGLCITTVLASVIYSTVIKLNLF